MAEKIELRSAQPKDRFNDPMGPMQPWREVSALKVVPRSSDDYEQRGAIIISGFMVVVKSKIAVDPQDEVRIRGKIYQIDGDVGDYGRKKIFYTKRAN